MRRAGLSRTPTRCRRWIRRSSWNGAVTTRATTARRSAAHRGELRSSNFEVHWRRRIRFVGASDSDQGTERQRRFADANRLTVLEPDGSANAATVDECSVRAAELLDLSAGWPIAGTFETELAWRRDTPGTSIQIELSGSRPRTGSGSTSTMVRSFQTSSRGVSPSATGRDRTPEGAVVGNHATKSIPDAVHGSHEARLLRVVVERRADLRHQVVEIGLHHVRSWPETVAQRLLVHHRRPIGDEQRQQVEGLRRQMQLLSARWSCRVGPDPAGNRRTEVFTAASRALREIVRNP